MNLKSTKAPGILVHPLTLVALTLYALNSFVLQPLAPSWLTGKLGDFAWIFFFPYVLTLILSLVLPEDPAFAFSVLVTGCGFALVKATSANAWLAGLLGALEHGPVVIAKDPGDLLALLALPACVWHWRRYSPAPGSAPRVALLLVPLVMGLMLADEPPIPHQIVTLKIDGSAILACSDYSTYRSTDGGVSWSLPAYQSADPDCSRSPAESQIVADPRDSQIRYRYDSYIIERSSDSGKTWRRDYTWRPLSQAEQVYAQATDAAYIDFDGRPYSAVGDPVSGNILFAMGSEGVLVRQAGSGTYTWVMVGPNRRYEIPKGSLVTHLLWGEALLGLIAGGLGITLLALRFRHSRLKAFFAWLGVAGWLGVVWILPPALATYGNDLLAIGLCLVGGLTAVLTVVSFVESWAVDKKLPAKFGLGLLALALLFFLPYLLWGLNVIPDYHTAAVVGTILALGATIYLQVNLPKWLPPKAEDAGGPDSR